MHCGERPWRPAGVECRDAVSAASATGWVYTGRNMNCSQRKKATHDVVASSSWWSAAAGKTANGRRSIGQKSCLVGRLRIGSNYQRQAVVTCGFTLAKAVSGCQ